MLFEASAASASASVSGSLRKAGRDAADVAVADSNASSSSSSAVDAQQQQQQRRRKARIFFLAAVAVCRVALLSFLFRFEKMSIELHKRLRNLSPKSIYVLYQVPFSLRQSRCLLALSPRRRWPRWRAPPPLLPAQRRRRPSQGAPAALPAAAASSSSAPQTNKARPSSLEPKRSSTRSRRSSTTRRWHRVRLKAVVFGERGPKRGRRGAPKNSVNGF